MDIGDLIFLIFIALGGLSSILGGKKKRQAAKSAGKTRPRPRPPRPAQAREVSRTGRDHPARRQPRQPESQMERILRDLGFDAVAVEDEPEPQAVVSSEIPLTRELPKTVSLERLDVEREARHQKFHDKYIKPVAAPEGARVPSRAERYVNAQSLRDAVLRMEILGTPKGLK